MLTRHKKAEKEDMEDESVMKISEEQSANANISSTKAAAPTNLDIMEAITNLSNSFDKKLEVISTTLLEVNVSLASISNRVAQTEEATKAHENRIESLERLCARLENDCERLREKTSDLESRSRWQNVRIVGIKEGVENGRPTEFVTKFLTRVLGEENTDNPVKIDRAHRSPQPLREGRSRAFIVRLHHYQVKERILHLARSKPLEYDGHKIHMFPDLAADVLKQRQKFDNIRKKCREHEVRCGFRFPSKFMVTVRGKETKVFESPESAEMYLRGAVENW
ncbi:putative LINE-1 type transposase domain-containing protein 1 [Triplophysa rosa]|uniref:LINE-1 type transposase domain-containing protein 1 n=1 Tax=Triplophysa rosa TaxID=992332 RepID=A0A9W7W7T7_TRIRA|nr:putative LINE-1 type transposase domain-containing protein 1 [Triplophysa rosa]